MSEKPKSESSLTPDLEHNPVDEAASEGSGAAGPRCGGSGELEGEEVLGSEVGIVGKPCPGCKGCSRQPSGTDDHRFAYRVDQTAGVPSYLAGCTCGWEGGLFSALTAARVSHETHALHVERDWPDEIWANRFTDLPLEWWATPSTADDPDSIAGKPVEARAYVPRDSRLTKEQCREKLSGDKAIEAVQKYLPDADYGRVGLALLAAADAAFRDDHSSKGGS